MTSELPENRRPKFLPEAEKSAHLRAVLQESVVVIGEVKKEIIAREQAAAVKAAAEVFAALEVEGALLPDGTVFVGKLEDGSKVYTTPRDARVAVKFNAAAGTGKHKKKKKLKYKAAVDFKAAAAYTERLNKTRKLGYSDWSLPTMEVLELLYNHSLLGALKGSFRESDVYDSEYWSSTPGRTPDSRRVKCFGDGTTATNGVDTHTFVRCVRVVPPAA